MARIRGFPWARRELTADDAVELTIYPIAGKQFFFTIPGRVCRECDLAHRQAVLAVEALEQRGVPVVLRVKPWVEHMIPALLKGGWHPPVITINGRIFCQGIVPDREALIAALERASNDAGVPRRRPVRATHGPLE